MTALVLALDDVGATVQRAGGKGASLARMAAAGLPVPPGFHVTTECYRRFAAADGLAAAIRAAAASAADRVPGLVAGRPMPPEVAEAIRAAYRALGDVPVAVRSSATAEDLPEMSFAGQQETYLNIHGETAVLAAVRRCWASLWTARAIDYRARNGIDPAELGMAVVVQQLVPADAAGVLFTADPVTGARDRVLINAAWGLGEAIVGGQVTPDTVVVAKAGATILRQDISDKRQMTVRTAGGTREQAVPREKRKRAALTSGQAAELTRLGVRIEQLYGRPMDIEWALHDGRPFVVQARPITALPAEARWPLPDPRGKYVRASVMELLPNPLSPLFATLGIPAWARATVDRYRNLGLPYFDDPLAVINGYGYYNVSYTPGLLARMALAQPRFLTTSLPRSLRTAPDRWRQAHDRYAGVTGRFRTTDVATAPAAELLAGARAIVDEAARYYLTIQSGVLPAAYLSESLFTAAYRVLKGPGDPPALIFLLGFDSTPVRAERALHDLAAAGDDFDERFAGYLSTYGNAVYDLDFATPLPAEDPAPVLQTLEFFRSGKAPDPRDRQRAARAARERAMRRLDSRRHAVTRRLLRWAQRMGPLREDALADVGLGWPVVRRLLRGIGHRLVAAGVIAADDDVFLLRLDEVEDAVRALDAGRPPVDAHAAVAGRRATWQAQRAAPPPHALPADSGTKLLGIDFARLLPSRGGRGSGEVIKGVPGSPGRVTAPARVIHDPAEFDRMRAGDVLVAKITTPAWTTLFALAGAVVTDVGGPLSHSSIVAREYHIPAVLGTGDATGRLTDGQRVTVDGDAGTVTPQGSSS